MSTHTADPTHVIAGHKAAIARDDVSEEAKEHSRQEIARLQGGEPEPEVSSHVIGGYKATITNPTTSDEAKANAQAKLAELGVDAYGATGAPVANDSEIDRALAEDDEHSHRVLGGFKATLSNPTTSDEAKEKAAEKLRLAGVEP